MVSVYKEGLLKNFKGNDHSPPRYGSRLSQVLLPPVVLTSTRATGSRAGLPNPGASDVAQLLGLWYNQPRHHDQRRRAHHPDLARALRQRSDTRAVTR